MNYLSDKSIGLIAHLVFSPWTQLLLRVNDRALSVNILPYLWYNQKRGCYECIRREDGFSPLIQRQYLTPSVGPIRAGGMGVSQTDSERIIEMDQAMRHFHYANLLKLKPNACNNTVYTLEDASVVNFSPICSNQRASHANALPFVFS